ncbi:MAG: transglycosylase SLT domain-containing protein [Methyloprofundus sp.]|nr:transglycosylase SLT domain-containing protein [Methyloprofundus sp.]
MQGHNMWIKFCRLLFTVVILIAGLESSANTREQQRQAFLQAEGRMTAEDFSLISKGLEDYPLYPYLEYQWLSQHLDKKVQIRDFLRNNKSSRYARKLRQQWLAYLYKHQNWNDFVAYYQTSRSKSGQCRYQWARYQLNYKTKALTETKKIWLTGRSLPKVCDPLLEKFSSSSFLTQALIWQRFELAIKARKLKLATYLSKKLSTAETKRNASQWLKLVKNPALVVSSQSLQGVSRTQQADMFVYAMKRLISKDVDDARLIWELKKSRYQMTQAQQDKVERSIALQLAFNKSDQAYAQFSQLTKLDATTRIWAVRAALIENNWAHVQDALNNLSTQEKQKQRWKYWQARTFLQTKQESKGRAIFAELAKERSYYGYIAADYLQQEYRLENKPIQIDEGKRSALLATKTFAMIQEFRFLKLEKEAQLSWWDALRGRKGSDLLIAAKIAQQWKWHKMAILTVAQAKHWDDVDLRFPIDFADKIQQNAQLQKLDQAIIYGLVRRESMFDEKAQSPVGALGLMQVMPRTGKQIAREIKFPWRSKSALLEAPTNIKFGAYYYKQMLDKFDGHYALAAAAYNAGPHRVIKWTDIKRDYAADVWVETIPFKETRAYVSAVLTYALIYQRQLGTGKLLMADFMRDIQPEKMASAHLLAEKK